MRLPLGPREDDEVRTFRIGLPGLARRISKEPLDFGSLAVRVDTGRSAPGRPFVASLS